MKITATLGALLVLLIGLILLFIYSGVYSVAATAPHTRLTEWALSTAMKHSVRRHARGIEPPPLSDSSLAQRGFHHYREMCVTCHGAPGASLSEIGKGLNPNAPELSEEVHEWAEAELFWITKHGIKMSGMPAFGPTHDDDELWAIIAFLKQLDSISPEDYQALAPAEEGEAPGHSDQHKH